MLKLMTPAIYSMILRSAETEGAPAAEEAPAAEKPAKPAKIIQNGQTRPAAGTKTARVWEIADAISAEQKRPALREEVMTQGEAEGLNRGTIATQYARWTTFHNVSKEDRTAVRTALTPAKPEPEADAAEGEEAPAAE